MALYEALYERKCRSPLCWELGERQLTGPELVQITLEKVPIIQQRLKIAFSRQKGHAYPKRKDVSFSTGDLVFLEVSPMNGVMKFGKKRKLAPRYIGPIEIRSRVGEMMYRLVLPPELSRIHPVFHVSILRKYIADPSLVLQPQAVELSEDLTYEKFSVAIVDRQICQLCTKEIPMVKVLWNNHAAEDCTWQTEAMMQVTYTYLFQF